MKKGKIAVIGVLPPPYGGISVHIERLCGVLADLDIPYVVYDESDENERSNVNTIKIDQVEKWSIRYLFKKNEDIINNHFLRWKVRFTLSLLRLKGKKIVHTVHSLREERYSFFHKIMIYLTGLLSNHFIVVNEEIRDKLLKLKIPDEKISVIPAFIRPVENEKVVLPAHINEVFEKSSHVILANGGIGNLHDGKELYGIDLCIEMFRNIVKDYPNASLLYCVTHVANEHIEKMYKDKIVEYGLEKQFILVKEKIPLYPLLKKASLFIRPTRSDGDSISIREALYYNVPVVTSDVVKRPSGVKLFNNNNIKNFTILCGQQLKREPLSDDIVNEVDQNKYVNEILSILMD